MEPKLTTDEALSHAPDLLGVIREFVQATKKTSSGGKRITPEEWLKIGEEAGVFGLGVLEDALD